MDVDSRPSGILFLAKFDAPGIDEYVVRQAWNRHITQFFKDRGIAQTRLSQTVPNRERNLNNWSHMVELDVQAVDGHEQFLAYFETAVQNTSATIGAKNAEMDIREYHLTDDWINDGYSPGGATHLAAVWKSVHDPEELARWYREEHIRLLFNTPGWLRCRRFTLVSGSGPTFLALHELASEETVDHPAAAPARGTPWHLRILADQTESEYRLYRILNEQ